MSSSNSSLRPAWQHRGNQGGGRGFQPPPQVASERSNSRSQSFGSTGGPNHHHQQYGGDSNENKRGNSSNFNKYAALDDDDDIAASTTAEPTSGGGGGSSSNSGNAGNNISNNSNNNNTRSEALRSGGVGGNSSSNVARNISAGRTGRSLADLVASVPNAPERERSTGGRYISGGRSNSISERGDAPTAATSSSSSSNTPTAHVPSSTSAETVKVTRFTRERLLSMRPPPMNTAPAKLVQRLEGSVILSDVPQDPVCWDTFDAEEIWSTVAPRRSTAIKGGPSTPGGPTAISTSTGVPSEDAAAASAASTGIRRLSGLGVRSTSREVSASGGGRWQRGVALPPPDQSIGGKKGRDRDSDDPSDLWDDPGSATDGGAALDFSSFGAIPPSDDADTPFDFEKMTEATKKFEEELHGRSRASSAAESDINVTSEVDDPAANIIKVDPKRPLASDGTTIRSGSGDNVNVFEDFDDPASSEGEDDSGAVGPRSSSSSPPAATTIKAMDEDPDASSRLMALIGVKKDPTSFLDPNPVLASIISPSTASSSVLNTTHTILEPPKLSSSAWGMTDPIKTLKSSTEGTVLGLSLNPWGDPILNTVASASHEHPQAHGLDLQARLREAELQQKAREDEARRRQEQEEAQHRAIAQQQEQERARQASLQTQQLQQQQQQAGVQSQVEGVLMERISTILENSWGQSGLISVLATLHSEDNRVIPLLGNVDALRALLLRNSQRIALRQDPASGAEMAALLMTNAQWQQHQQQQQAQAHRLRAQEEELQRREHQRRIEEQQRRMEEQQAAVARAQQQQQVRPIISDAPWYYSDPQKNIQGPFRGEEMRQWLEAGYFKGDLPISQQAVGPFIPLSVIFPDLSIAFMATKNAVSDEAAARAKAADERARFEAAERERLENERRAEVTAERELRALEAERKRLVRESAERERQTLMAEELEARGNNDAVVAAGQHATGSNGGNESSAQLKMLLGLNSQFAAPLEAKSQPLLSPVAARTASSLVPVPVASAEPAATNPQQSISNDKAPSEKKISKYSTKGTGVQNHVPAIDANASQIPVASAAPAWGGAAVSKPATKKSMSEIQKEEARAAAAAAMRQEGSRSSNSGWANVAAARGGSNAWAGGAAQPKVTALISKQSVGAAGPPTSLRPSASQQRTISTSGSNNPQMAATQGQPQMQRSVSLPGNNAVPGAVDAFGAKMSPLLEKWCKDQMQKLNGTDDLTLVSFCMTLSDPIEIRQYLTTYLGSTPQVNNFATEFINRAKGGTKEKIEEWESTVTVKKGRKKKTSGGGSSNNR